MTFSFCRHFYQWLTAGRKIDIHFLDDRFLFNHLLQLFHQLLNGDSFCARHGRGDDCLPYVALKFTDRMKKRTFLFLFGILVKKRTDIGIEPVDQDSLLIIRGGDENEQIFV